MVAQHTSLLLQANHTAAAAATGSSAKNEKKLKTLETLSSKEREISKYIAITSYGNKHPQQNQPEDVAINCVCDQR